MRLSIKQNKKPIVITLIVTITEIDGTWICDEDAIMPDSIVTKYGAKYD